MAEPVWVDHIPKVTPPLTLTEEDAKRRRDDLNSIRIWGARGGSGYVQVLLLAFGKTEMRRLGLAPPPRAPNPYNPSGLILRGGGGAFDIAAFPTYPEAK